MRYRTPEDREARNAYMRKYRAEHREEYNERKRQSYAEHREERNSYMRNYRTDNAEYREESRVRQRKWREEHPEHIKVYHENRTKWRAEHLDEYRRHLRAYKAIDVNRDGVTKHKIRKRSKQILYKTHTKLSDYEIHHAFGYEDPNKFIYIPKTLHLQIHQFLRDSNIPADSNHWNAIRDLVNSYEGYTYIRT